MDDRRRAAIDRIVANAPPLTSDQVVGLRRIFNGQRRRMATVLRETEDGLRAVFTGHKVTYQEEEWFFSRAETMLTVLIYKDPPGRGATVKKTVPAKDCGLEIRNI
jgi:hypothetical protein